MTKELENVAHYLYDNAPQRAVLTYTLLFSPPLSLSFFLPSFPPTLLWRSAFLCVWFWDKISLGSSRWPWNLNHSSASTSECWDYRCVLLYPALTALLKIKDSLTICTSIEMISAQWRFYFLLMVLGMEPRDSHMLLGTQSEPHHRVYPWSQEGALPKTVPLGGWVSIYSRSMTNAGKVSLYSDYYDSVDRSSLTIRGLPENLGTTWVILLSLPGSQVDL